MVQIGNIQFKLSIAFRLEQMKHKQHKIMIYMIKKFKFTDYIEMAPIGNTILICNLKIKLI